MIRFNVTDTGIGLSASQQKLIFEPFRQADGSVTRKYGGTGLGLAICSSLVKMMGGAITVSSLEGQGSTFSFTIRCQLCQQPKTTTQENPIRPTEVAGMAKLRVLLAEDNPVNQLLVVRLLEGRGHQVVVAGNGREAVAVASQQSFDMVLMDVQMPEMDGFEATRILRERTGAQTVPIIAMTAHAMQGDREKCLSAGMNAYISKPIRPEELFDTIKQLTAGQAVSL